MHPLQGVLRETLGCHPASRLYPQNSSFPTWQLPLDFKDPLQIKLILKWKEFEILACHSQLVPLCTVFFRMVIQIASKASKGMAMCLGPFSRVPHGISYMDFFSGNLRKKILESLLGSFKNASLPFSPNQQVKEEER